MNSSALWKLTREIEDNEHRFILARPDRHFIALSVRKNGASLRSLTIYCTPVFSLICGPSRRLECPFLNKKTAPDWILSTLHPFVLSGILDAYVLEVFLLASADLLVVEQGHMVIEQGHLVRTRNPDHCRKMKSKEKSLSDYSPCVDEKFWAVVGEL